MMAQYLQVAAQTADIRFSAVLRAYEHLIMRSIPWFGECALYARTEYGTTMYADGHRRELEVHLPDDLSGLSPAESAQARAESLASMAEGLTLSDLLVRHAARAALTDEPIPVRSREIDDEVVEGMRIRSYPFYRVFLPKLSYRMPFVPYRRIELERRTFTFQAHSAAELERLVSQSSAYFSFASP